MMKEIKCPNCGKPFQIDESGYNEIVAQIRGTEFEKELTRRENEIKARQELEFANLNESHQRALDELNARLTAAATHQTLAVTEAVQKKEEDIRSRDNEIAKLQAQLSAQLESAATHQALAVTEALQKKEQEINSRDSEIAKLKAMLTSQQESAKTNQNLAVIEAVQSKNEELQTMKERIVTLEANLQTTAETASANEANLRMQYEDKLKGKDEEIAHYRDMKARLSTKMIGETLEQHCATQFAQIRTALPNATFEKDNDAKAGETKGDFIYREFADDGTPLLSIMFEMKNEADTTATKHKNEDFFKKLDQDRNNKKCEYAVLVSMLELENEIYATGITDVSTREYEKMYVVRPQAFIPMIMLLRNMALRTLDLRRELALARSCNIDIEHFEENMNSFKEGFARNYRLASEKFTSAIDEIDKSIRALQKTKEYLMASENNLRLANNKADALSIRSLTKGAPSVRALFENNANA